MESKIEYYSLRDLRNQLATKTKEIKILKDKIEAITMRKRKVSRPIFSRPEFADVPQIAIMYFNEYYKSDFNSDVLIANNRKREYVLMRNICYAAMFCFENENTISFKDIGRIFGNRDHATIMHGVVAVVLDMNAFKNEIIKKHILTINELICEKLGIPFENADYKIYMLNSYANGMAKKKIFKNN